MPWTPNQAKGHTHAANTPEKSALWAGTANGVLNDSDGDEGKAIRIANAQVNGSINHHHKAKSKSKLAKITRAKHPVRDSDYA